MKIRKKIIALVLVLSCFLSCLIATPIYANNIQVVGTYSKVMEDLEQDSNFDAKAYETKANDYSLEVITIAESNDNELFVYVYQPNENYGKYIATSINISQKLHNSLEINNLTLTLLDFDTVFQKYKVNDLAVEDTETRYYEIVSIYRKYDSAVDKALNDDNNNTINEVVYKVAKQYTFKNTNDGVILNVADTEVITVVDKFVGYVRYQSGFTLFPESCDSHFVAFSTDKDIDTLYEADVYFTTQSYSHRYYSNGMGDETYTFQNVSEEYAYLNYTESYTFEAPGVFGNTFTWNRIQTVNDFIASVELDNVYNCAVVNVGISSSLSESTTAQLENKDWVLRFKETNFSRSVSINDQTKLTTIHDNATMVGNVTILRLKFETQGVIYDLGVIDNKQTGSLNPSNTTTTTLELTDMFKLILSVLFLIVLIIVLWPILPIIFKLIGWLLKAVWWLVCLPFKIIGFIFEKDDKNKKGNSNGKKKKKKTKK